MLFAFPHFSSIILTLLYDGDQLQWLLVRCLSVGFSPALLKCSNLNLLCVSWRLIFLFFLKNVLHKSFQTSIITIHMLL